MLVPADTLLMAGLHYSKASGVSLERFEVDDPSPGNWTWQTTCADTNDAGLHNRNGSVDVMPSTGSNPLYQHGYLRVAESRRYLTHADGTPFLWLGDTAWAVPHKAADHEWEAYLADRTAKQFTHDFVTQRTLLAEGVRQSMDAAAWSAQMFEVSRGFQRFAWTTFRVLKIERQPEQPHRWTTRILLGAAGEDAAGGEPLDEGPPRGFAVHAVDVQSIGKQGRTGRRSGKIAISGRGGRLQFGKLERRRRCAVPLDYACSTARYAKAAAARPSPAEWSCAMSLFKSHCTSQAEARLEKAGGLHGQPDAQGHQAEG